MEPVGTVGPWLEDSGCKEDDEDSAATDVPAVPEEEPAFAEDSDEVVLLSEDIAPLLSEELTISEEDSILEKASSLDEAGSEHAVKANGTATLNAIGPASLRKLKFIFILLLFFKPKYTKKTFCMFYGKRL
jgi:hypothetical protein